MEQKNKKIFQISLIIIIGVLVFILAGMLVYKNKKVAPVFNDSNINKNQNNLTKKNTEEKKAELIDVVNIVGKIISIDIDTIKVLVNEEEKNLKVPARGANFVKQAKQKDGSFLNTEIGLFDIPKNKDAEVQYNGATNEVMLIVVK